MPRPIFTHLLPTLFEPADLRGGTAVVMDVLRATTVIVQALAHGAERVIPCSEVDEARKIAASLPAGTAVLGGERLGLRIDGFDLGNSPAEYTAKTVGNKTLVFTTTNGTRALERAFDARRVLVGAFVNLSAVVRVLTEETGPVHLVCAGTNRKITREDVLCAGHVSVRLCESAGFDADDDATQLAISLYQSCGDHYDPRLAVLRNSRGGRNLIELGLAADIADAARLDLFNIVPELSRDPWEIHVAGSSSLTPSP